jgi:predicted HD phosphohydrolase
LEDATPEDYDILRRHDELFAHAIADRVLAAVTAMDREGGALRVTRYEHSLQSASRAHRDGKPEEYVVAALIHDIGDSLAPHTHGEMVSAIMRPYVSEEICWVVAHHGIFQTYYLAHVTGADRDARDVYKTHPYYGACVEFCERYDQNCFDPEYDSFSIDFFESMVRRVFSEPRYLDSAHAGPITQASPEGNAV